MDKKNTKIDFVIIWVDGADPEWLKKKSKYMPSLGEDVQVNRYRDWETLPFWFRGVEKFAPWVNHVYFVNDHQIPKWMNTQNPKLTVVDHTDYIPKKYLPTFSSHPIELNIHRIPELSENFVYFNDDVFLVKPVEPELFFKDGIPCDDAILSPIILDGMIEAGKVCANMMNVINKHFDKNTVINNSRGKWFHPCYGKQLLRTFCLMPWHHLPGFYNDHLPQPFLKATFETVWQEEFELLDEVCSHRFRDYSRDVNQWLMRYWQFCEGNFTPISPRRGSCFNDVCDEALDTIKNQKKAIVCINDNEETAFEQHKKALLSAFKSILPEKSSFEL